jgi:hypothetical protein
MKELQGDISPGTKETPINFLISIGASEGAEKPSLRVAWNSCFPNSGFCGWAHLLKSRTFWKEHAPGRGG